MRQRINLAIRKVTTVSSYILLGFLLSGFVLMPWPSAFCGKIAVATAALGLCTAAGLAAAIPRLTSRSRKPPAGLPTTSAPQAVSAQIRLCADPFPAPADRHSYTCSTTVHCAFHVHPIIRLLTPTLAS